VGAGLADEVGRISGNSDDLVPRLLENADDPLADEQLVFPDDNADADEWTLSYSTLWSNRTIAQAAGS
jgi:hypothetical protein